MMKKMHLFALVSALCLLLTGQQKNAVASAQPDDSPYVSIKDLREMTPERFVGSYEAHGRKIEIDAPIIVPPKDNLPIVNVQYQRFNGTDIENKLAPLLPHNSGTVFSASYGEGGLFLTCIPKSGSKHDAGVGPMAKYGTVTMVNLNGLAENNKYSSAAPFLFFQSVLKRIGLDVSAIALTGQMATTGSYPIKKDGIYSYDPYDYYYYVNKTAPVPGYEKGHYELAAHQLLDGVRIFDGIYWATSNTTDPPDPCPHITLYILDEDDFQLELKIVEETAIGVLDVPLVPFKEIQSTIEQYIAYGLIRRVDEIELGYMLYYAQNVKIGPNTWETPLVAVPVWRITGEIGYDAQEEYIHHNIETALIKAGLCSSGIYELRIHAQTGEAIDKYDETPPRCMPRFFGWDDVSP